MSPAESRENQVKSTLKEEALNQATQELEKDLFVWTAPARPFKRRNREFYITIIAICVVVGLILFLVEGFMPVILIISLVFLFYIMNTVEPENIEYGLTNKGIKIAGRKTEWKEMVRFWFSRRFDSQLLIVQIIKIPGRLELVINEKDREEVKKTMLKYLPFEEVAPSFLDKIANWFSSKLPQG